MRKRFTAAFLCVSLSLALALPLTACSSGDSSIPDSSSAVKRDNDELFAGLLEGIGKSEDAYEEFTLDGRFDKQAVADVSVMGIDSWVKLGTTEQFRYSVGLLDMWMYYGDDASIRLQPYQIVDAVSLSLYEDSTVGGNMMVLEAALNFAKPANADMYYNALGIEKPADDSSADDSSDELPVQTLPAESDEPATESEDSSDAQITE